MKPMWGRSGGSRLRPAPLLCRLAREQPSSLPKIRGNLGCAEGIPQDPVRFGALETLLAKQVVIRKQLQLAIHVPRPGPMPGKLDVPLLQEDLPRQVSL